MSPDLIALGRRAVASRHYEMLPGTLSLPDKHGRVWMAIRPVTEARGVLVQVSGRKLRQPPPHPNTLLPDLSQSGSRGCMLDLNRKAYSDDSIHVVAGTHDGELVWDVWDCNQDIAPLCSTEAEALVVALEAAP